MQTKADELSEYMILNDNLRGEVQRLRQQVEGAKARVKLPGFFLLPLL